MTHIPKEIQKRGHESVLLPFSPKVRNITSDSLLNHFVDFITITQSYDFDIPEMVTWVNTTNRFNKQTGEIEDYQGFTALRIKGSYETSIGIKSQGRTVQLTGNIGHLNRPDNVFNYSFEDTIKLCNRIMSVHGLPDFTMGETGITSGRNNKPSLFATGARISRLDLTTNLGFDSQDDLKTYQKILMLSKDKRVVQKAHQDTLNVTYGSYRNRNYKIDLYDKLAELKAHKKYQNISEELKLFLSQNHILRLEYKMLSKTIARMQNGYLAFINNKLLNDFFKNEALSLLKNKEVKIMDIHKLTGSQFQTFENYRNGRSLVHMKKSTFYDHRSAIKKKLGVDIGVPCKVSNIDEFVNRKVQIIEPKVLSMPDFYELPAVDNVVCF